MRVAVFVLACLACASNGRRMQQKQAGPGLTLNHGFAHDPAHEAALMLNHALAHAPARVTPGHAALVHGHIGDEPTAGQLLTVEVPPGASAGMMLQVQTPVGLLEVEVPEGVGPGMTFQAQVPESVRPKVGPKEVQLRESLGAGAHSAATTIVSKHERKCASGLFVAQEANEFDVWWAQRTRPPDALQLNRDSVLLVLTEFVQSMYARQAFDYCNVEPSGYGQICGMFESVHLVDDALMVKVKQALLGRKTVLLDVLAKYLRARIPEMVQVEEVHRDGRNIF